MSNVVSELSAQPIEIGPPPGGGPMVSIVVPVYDEYENLRPLVEAVEAVMRPLERPFELIVIDDGSRDGTRSLLGELERDYAWLVVLTLTRNYGQSTALQAGFDRAVGEYVVTLDGDLQNDPADIPMMIGILDDKPEVDCVSGWRVKRQDAALSRKLPSRIANRLISRVTHVKLHDYGCALKAYRSRILHELHLYGEQHRFIPALAAEVGARIEEVPVNHRARNAGRSKYGVDRTMRVLLDLLWIRFTMRFLHRPMHAFGGLALTLMGGGAFILIWLAGQKLIYDDAIGGRPLFWLGMLLTLLGTQFLATGLLGELLTRIYHEPHGRKQYVLAERREGLRGARLKPGARS